MTLSAYSGELNLIEWQIKKAAWCFTPSMLKDIPLDILGLLYLSRFDGYPCLKTQLPGMPSDEIQQHWTGATGHSLMARTCAFVKTMTSTFNRITRRNLENHHMF